MTSDERAQAKADEMQLIVFREVASLAALAVMLLLLHPSVNVWLRHQAWKLRQHAGRRAQAEDAAVAELRRDISRYEHGEAAL